MKYLNSHYSLLTMGAIAMIAALAPARGAGPVATEKVRAHVLQESKGTAVVFPWSFQNGHGDSHKLAIQSGEEVARRAGYSAVPRKVAVAAWKSDGFSKPVFGRLPTHAQLQTYGKSLQAQKVVYGSVSWHTRSIWVNLGPKTVSTATINVYVFDVAANRVVFKKLGVTGRSDEKSDGYKIAADVLFTPLVTMVSGGPATPQEQRAVQIALGRAYHDWAMAASH